MRSEIPKLSVSNYQVAEISKQAFHLTIVRGFKHRFWFLMFSLVDGSHTDAEYSKIGLANVIN